MAWWEAKLHCINTPSVLTYTPSQQITPTPECESESVTPFSCIQLFCDPMDCRLPGSSVHGILQARILEWVADFSRGSSWPRDWPGSLALQADSLPSEPPGKPHIRTSVQFSSVAQSCQTLCDPMDCSIPGLPVHHQLPEFTQTHVHWTSDAIQPSHPLSSPSPPAFNLFQHQGLFKWISSLHQVFASILHQSIGVSALASVLPMNIQDWSPLG